MVAPREPQLWYVYVTKPNDAVATQMAVAEMRHGAKEDDRYLGEMQFLTIDGVQAVYGMAYPNA